MRVFLGFRRGSTQRGAEKEGETQRWESTEPALRSGIAGKVLDSCQGVWDSELRLLGLLLPTELVPPPGSLPGSRADPAHFGVSRTSSKREQTLMERRDVAR